MCEFCYEFNIVKDLNKAHPAVEGNSDYKIKYYSCFIEDTFYKGKYAGRITRHKHELNYCPECGRKLRNGK